MENNEFIEIEYKYDLFRKLKLKYNNKYYDYFDLYISGKSAKEIPYILYERLCIDNFYKKNKDHSLHIRIGIKKTNYDLFYIIITGKTKNTNYTSYNNEKINLKFILNDLLNR